MSNKENKNTDLSRNTGFLHTSTNKSKDGSPDYFGSMDINGVIYALGGWKKEGSESGVKYIALNLDFMDQSIDEREAQRQSIMKDYKADKKKKENKDLFVMIEQTGSLHVQADTSKKEDFYGTVLLNGEKIYINGFSTTGKQEQPVVRLSVSDGMKSKDERSKLAASFMG